MKQEDNMADPNTMEKFAELMRDSDDMSKKVVTSQKLIYENQKLLKDNMEKLGSINREILDKLERWDVMQRGNTGWEARTLNFLLTYHRLINE